VSFVVILQSKLSSVLTLENFHLACCGVLGWLSKFVTFVVIFQSRLSSVLTFEDLYQACRGGIDAGGARIA